MDFPTLSTFVTVAECASFSVAAERLYMTQPAVSKRIASLEDDLNVKLFDRLGRGIVLTEAGEKFLISSRRILSDIATSREEVRSMTASVSGRLRLATSHHAGLHRMPPVLKNFTQSYPDVELDLLFMDSEVACEAVAEGDIELAVITLPERPDSSLTTQLIWPDPLSIVCAPEHALIQQAKTHPITPEALAEHRAVLPARGTITRRILLEALQPFGVSVKTSLETNYLETIKMMVSVGLGWSALPMTMLDNELIAIEVKDLHMQRELGSVHLRERTLSRAARAFLEQLHSPKEH